VRGLVTPTSSNNLVIVSVFNSEGDTVDQTIGGLRGLSYHRDLGTVQSQLLSKLEAKRKSVIEHTLATNPAYLTWWRSQHGTESGQWIQAVPAYAKMCLSNKQYCTALRYRAYMQMCRYVDGIRCHCHRHPVLDPLGHHLATECPKGNHRQFTHNSLVNELNDILHYCGFWTRVEDYGVFHDINVDNNTRPDITILNPLDPGMTKLLLDVGVTSPVTVRLRVAIVCLFSRHRQCSLRRMLRIWRCLEPVVSVSYR
jgi:hypothetical protein